MYMHITMYDSFMSLFVCINWAVWKHFKVGLIVLYKCLPKIDYQTSSPVM